MSAPDNVGQIAQVIRAVSRPATSAPTRRTQPAHSVR